MKKLAVSVALLALTGCASIIDGTSQTLTVNTNPPGANCDFMREGQVIASIANTPGGVVVEKTKHDINVVCKKAGYQDATYFNNSGVQEATFGNIVAGGVIGWGIDSASGADNKYTPDMNITLVPLPSQPAPVAETSTKKPRS